MERPVNTPERLADLIMADTLDSFRPEAAGASALRMLMDSTGPDSMAAEAIASVTVLSVRAQHRCLPSKSK